MLNIVTFNISIDHSILYSAAHVNIQTDQCFFFLSFLLFVMLQLCFDLMEDWIRKNPKASICTDEGVNEFRNIANFQDYHGLPEFRQVNIYMNLFLKIYKLDRIICTYMEEERTEMDQKYINRRYNEIF